MSRTMSEGLAWAEYQMVRKKAERNMETMQGTQEVPAKESLEAFAPYLEGGKGDSNHAFHAIA